MLFIFFFKQKTAYEMCISDWSSDVCSSDLPDMMSGSSAKKIRLRTLDLLSCATGKLGDILAEALRRKLQCFDGCQVGKDCLAKGLCRHYIGRASCREKVCPFV